MDRDFLIDLFADFGPVTIRRMFSGFGISADATNFALALRGGLYLRADEQTIPQFEAEGSQAVSVSDPGQDGHRQLVLAAAGAAVRRSRRFDGMGKGIVGRCTTRSAAQTTEGEEESGRKSCGGEARGKESSAKESSEEDVKAKARKRKKTSS